MANFSDILDKPATEIERPKPLPVGTYTWVVRGLPRYDKSTKKGTPYAEFTLECLGPGDDVDVEALEEAGGFTGKTLRLTFYLTEEAAYRAKDFAIDCGVEIEGLTLGQMLEACNGCQVLAEVRHQASEDGERIYAQIGKTTPF